MTEPRPARTLSSVTATARADAARALRKEQREQRSLAEQYAVEVLADASIAAPPTTIDVGAICEQLAVDLLEREGYEIVERNYRCDAGEIDIIAIEGDVMAFIEVRSRADDDHGAPVESVNRRKQQKVTRVAEVYLALHDPPFDEFRFDVVTITGLAHEHVDLYRDAWRGGLL